MCTVFILDKGQHSAAYVITVNYVATVIIIDFYAATVDAGSTNRNVFELSFYWTRASTQKHMLLQ